MGDVGDHTASLWQLRESSFEHIQTFIGHTAAVKTVAFRRSDSNCFASGSCDNNILIWDTRAANPIVNRINRGHEKTYTLSGTITGLSFQV